MTPIRTGQAPAPMSRADFHERFKRCFHDTAFDAERDAIARLEAIAWDAMQEGRKAPFTQPRHLDAEALARDAESTGLDMNRFRAEMADRIHTQRVQEHRRAGETSGVRATPAFFLNGAAVDVSFGFERLEAAIHAALARR